MADERIGDVIVSSVPRDMLIDLADELRGRTARAFQIVSENTDLDHRRKNRAAGMLRFHLNEKGFEDVAHFHGGAPLLNGELPEIELQVHQPYKQFGNVLLGFATAIEPGCAPAKNKSRVNAAQLNFDFMSNLKVETPRSSTIFVLMVIYRDPQDPAKVAELGIGVLASDHSHFIFYEKFEAFIVRYAKVAVAESVKSAEPAQETAQIVKLKTAPRRYRPPEEPEEQGDASGKE